MKIQKLKILKFLLIPIITILAILILIPIIFEDKITHKVKEIANQNLNAKLEFSHSKVSFFSHFPSLTLTLTKFDLKGSAPYQNESLLKSDKVGFGINFFSIFSNKIKIEEIYLNNSQITILVNKKGEANYNIYKSEKSKEKTESDNAIQIENISIENSSLSYIDYSSNIKFISNGLNYIGKGDLEKVNFSLNSSLNIKDLSFSYNNQEYLKNKSLKADLITKINTNSLSFIFEKNDLIINKLPVTFKGFFDFIENGYNMNFTLNTINSNLHDLFTALPPEYVQWLKKTEIRGNTNAHFSLIGKYVVSQNYKPDVNFNISIQDGFVSHQKAPEPAQNIYLNLKTKIPSLDINKLEVNLDSIYFTVGKDYFKSKIKTEGFGKKMSINSLIQSKIDLAKLQRAIGYNEIKIKGNLTTDIIAQGKLDLDSKVFPATKGQVDLTYGSLQTKYYPKPIENITIQSLINSPTSNLKDAEIKFAPVQLNFEGKPFNISGSLKNVEDVNYDLKIDGTLNLSKIYKVFSQKGLDFEGLIDTHLSLSGKQSDATSGKINKLKNSGTLHLKDIKISSQYLPKPFYIYDGSFIFKQDKMNFSNFKSKYESADIVMNGYLQNVINFVMSKNEILKGSFEFYSKYLNVNELIPSNNNIDSNSKPAAEKSVSTTSNDKIIEIPKNFDLSFLLKADETQFDDVKIKDLGGLISIKKGTLTLKNASLNIIDCKANINLTYKDINSEKATFSTQIKATEFDIKRAYNEIKMFKKMVTSAKNAEGIISLDYNLKGDLNKRMEPIYPSLTGSGSLAVKNIKFNGYKLMNVIASKTDNSSLKDPNIEDIVINSKIKNNIINIERFKFKTSGFRIRFEGQASFDGRLNLKTRIGLPPLGIIGIPLKIQGTQEKPKIKIGSKSQDLQGTEF